MSQDYDTPLCVHCSDPLDEDGRDLITGETFCGANPNNDKHQSPDDKPECPGHGPGTEDEPDFCDGSCVDEEAYARLMAGLRGIDLNDRYPKADADGIIRLGSDAVTDEPLPRCECPYWQDYHNDDCPHYTELLARRRTT